MGKKLVAEMTEKRSEKIIRDNLTLGERLNRDVRQTLKDIGKNRSKYLFVAPYFVLFFVFTVCPVLISMFFSLTNFNLLEAPTFVGFRNYYRMFMADDLFIKALGNTIMFAMITGPGGYIISLVMAWFLNELPRAVRVVLTVLLYAPSLTGGMTPIFKILFSSDAQGYVNATLLDWGIITAPIKYLENKDYVVPIIIFVVLWGSLGTSFLSFIGGLQGIGREYYEAAAMDGIRNRWQELWYVTLPSMKPQLMFGAVMQITQSFAVADISIQLAGNPSVNYAGATVVTHLLDYSSTRYEMGYASAIATVLFLLMVGTNKFVQKILGRVGE